MHLARAPRGQAAEQCRQRDAARARAQHVDVAGSGDLAHRVDRLVERTDVGVEAPVARASRVGLRQLTHERLNAAAKRRTHEALGRREVEHVVFVDLRRHDRGAAARGPRRGRRVLDQLEQLVPEDDRARRVRQLRPTVNGRASTCLGRPRPLARSSTRFARPRISARATGVDELSAALPDCAIRSWSAPAHRRAARRRSARVGAAGSSLASSTAAIERLGRAQGRPAACDGTPRCRSTRHRRSGGHRRQVQASSGRPRLRAVHRRNFADCRGRQRAADARDG